MNAFLESDQPMREIENENDVLRDLILKAGVEANAHVAAAKLQKVLIGELHPREEHAAYLILLFKKLDRCAFSGCN